MPSDPLTPQQPALPDEVREAALQADFEAFEMNDALTPQRATARQWYRGGWDAAAAHFAADRAALIAQVEGLEAVIAEALTVHPQAWPDNAAPCTCSVCAILSASPSSVVAGIKREVIDWHHENAWLNTAEGAKALRDRALARFGLTTAVQEADEPMGWVGDRAAAIREVGEQQ